MNGCKRWTVALGILSVLGTWARAEAPAPGAERVRALVLQLDDDRFSARRDAEQALRGLGVAALPLLKKELAGAPSLEARSRLAGVIEHLSHIHWQRDVSIAVRQARQTGKPLLVFTAAGLPGAPMSLECAAMQQRTFSDLDVVAFLNANFVLAWHDPTPGELLTRRVHQLVPQFTAEQVQACGEGAGTNVQTFLCAPDGHVLQYLAGFQGPRNLLKEAARTPELAKGPRPTPAANPVPAAVSAQAMNSMELQVAQVQLTARPVAAPVPLAAPVGRHVWDVVVEIELSMRTRLYYGC